MTRTAPPSGKRAEEEVPASARASDYFYFGVASPLASRLPAWMAYGLAALYADARSFASPTERREVVICLRRVFPGMSERAASRVARGYFRNRASVRVDVMRLVGNGHALTGLVDAHGLQHLDEAVSAGKGAILCSGHYGSVRACAGVLGALGYKVTLIANWSFAPDPSKKDALRKAMIWRPIRHHLRRENLLVRTSRGTDLAVALKAADILKHGEVILTNVDAVTPEGDVGRAVTVDFLGGHTPVVPGPAELARATGARLMSVFLRRRGLRRLDLTVRPVWETGRDAMQRCLHDLQSEIRDDPAQWEHWDMRKLVRLGLFPREAAVDFYKKEYGGWRPWV